MFFRKKKKKQDDAAPDNRRKHYRRAPGKKHSLGVILEAGNGPGKSGDIIDLSAGGAAIAFPAVRDPKLTKEQTVRLKFSSLSHGGEIVVKARTVILTGTGKEDRRYSFEFQDVASLYEQLDSYYSAFFNRRELVRARPALDRKLPIHVQADGESIDLTVNELSLKGVSVTLGLDRSSFLQNASQVDVKFTLPKTTTEIASRVEIRHATPRGVSMCFGMEFTAEDLAAVQHADFDSYMQRRIEEMAKWESH